MSIDVDELVRKIENITRGHEAIPPGSEIEHRVAEIITSFVDELKGTSYSVTEVLIKSWRSLQATIEACGKEYNLVPGPRCQGGYYEADARPLRLGEALSDNESLAGYVVTLPFSSDIRSLYARLASRRPSALIAYDKDKHVLALTESPFTNTNLCATEIPIAYTQPRIIRKILHCNRLRLILHDERNWARSTIIEAWNSVGNPNVLITVSLDTLSAPILLARSIALAFTIFKLTTKQGIGARLAILPASTLGDPRHPGFLPGYGAEIYAKILRKSMLDDNIALAIHIHSSSITNAPSIIYPSYLRLDTVSKREINYEHLWSNATIFSSYGIPSVTIITGGGQISSKQVLELVNTIADWRSLSQECTRYFYSNALEKPIPRLHNIVYKLRRIAEKAVDERDYDSAIMACRVLLEASYRVYDVNASGLHRLSNVLFPPLGCFERDYEECYDVVTGESWGITKGFNDVYALVGSHVVERVELLYEEYYMRGLLTKGSL